MTDPMIEAARSDGHRFLTEPEAKSVLAGAGIEGPDHQVAETPDEAVAAADRLGYPVVLKVVSSGIQHKSEWGDGAGVAVGLEGAADVRQAARRITATLNETDTDGQLLVEVAADTDAGYELLLGGTRHDSFGPTVTIGLGGVYTEVFDDVAHRLAPVEPSQARSMLSEFAGGKLLGGVRGRPVADVDAVVEAVVAVGDCLVSEPGVTEVDVNPLLVTADGAMALDALIAIEAAD